MTKNTKLVHNKSKAQDVKLLRVFSHYWKFAKNYKWFYLILTLLYMLGAAAFVVVRPKLYSDIVDKMHLGEEWDKIFVIFLFILALILIRNLFFLIADYLTATYQMKALVDLHNYVFRRIINHANSFFENNFVGALVNKANTFVRAFESIMDIFLFKLFWAGFQALAALVILFFTNFYVGLIFGIWLIIYTITTILFIRRGLVLDYIKAREQTKRTGVLADVISNIFNVKIFASRHSERKNYSGVVDVSMGATTRSWLWGNRQWMTNNILFLILEVTALGYSLHLWSVGGLTIGEVVLVQIYFGVFFASLWDLGRSFKTLVTSISDAKEMVYILDQPVEVKDVQRAEELKVIKGEITFEEVGFSYPNQKDNVFQQFNLNITAGQSVGLVGTSGAGKTTITKLLLRFADLNAGRISIDGQDVSRVTQDSLRDNVSYVPQEPVLFHRSIYENIAYAKPDATEKEILTASKKAHVHEFVQTLEKDYDTMVGERGVKLSGGQKQRVALARAFLKNSPILVLDEATSALDSVSEEFIQDALFKLMKGKTVIIVAHRLSTIQRLDRILVIEDGQVKEDGTHQELIKKPGIYKGFWERQTRQFV